MCLSLQTTLPGDSAPGGIIHTNNLSSWLHLAAIGGIILSEKCLRDPLARINIQTEIVNGERGHYLVWSVRVKG